MSLLNSKSTNIRHKFCSAVIVAAGTSSRMGEDKMLSDIGGMPVLVRTISAFENSTDVDEIIVVTRQDLLQTVSRFKEEYHFSKLCKIVIGGNTRTKSALAGVSEASKNAKIICIHDGARPFVSSDVIHDAIHNAIIYQAAVPGIPLKDTVKVSNNNRISLTPARDTMFIVQTPQAFQADIVKAALTKAVQSGINYTDDSGAVEAIGIFPRKSLGSEYNIKITTPIDLVIGRAILTMEEKKIE